MSTNPIFNYKSVLMWALQAQTGERMVYAHRSHSGLTATPELDYTEAYKAHDAGLVFLCQRRVERGWDYEATRISLATAKLLRVGPAGRGMPS